ncbi:TrmB family transcriptional regulator [Mangrovimicrobium sediminis]|uniref:TrmB family transcriptional regulator n=1 Tax=Mangrovimicrobium sediminis TaxID=2562682 RepID=A0A4Z0M027_9GAMM|nr:helix-turn-helix domain-containing protein [Haliea sp. SAOS-164]TGD72774.1 TrmB family transcriptional regulator [Haliea sp. SAOS-164]
MKLDSLLQLGLDERDVTVYRALLKLGPASIREVAAESGVNRGTTYETLKQLASRGVVSYFPRGKRRVFQAEEPERLLQLGERRQQALSQAMEQLRSEVIPELKQSQARFNPGNVRFYEGDDGVELVLRDILDSAGKDPERGYAVISTKTLRQHLYRPFPNFTKQREARGIRVRVIAVGEGGDEAEYAERKWLPSEADADASYIAIYPPKVAMITLAARDYPVVVIIDSAAIASTQQLMFDTLWRLL